MPTRKIAERLLVCTIAASLAMPVVALALPGLREQTQGEIEFISGGVGERERTALINISNAYNMFLVMSRESGAYVADVHVTVRDGNGQTVLDTSTRGPFLLADLPDGRYEVEAQASGQRTERVTVDVAEGDRLARTFLAFKRQ